MKEYKYEMTAGTSKVWAQDDTGDPRGYKHFTSSQLLVIEGMQPWELCKTSVRPNKTYAYPAYIPQHALKTQTSCHIAD